MRSLPILFIFATICVLSTNGYLADSIESYSRDVSPPGREYKLVHDLSNKTGGYYYAYCKEEEYVNKKAHVKCEVTEEIPVSYGVRGKKTCFVEDEVTMFNSVRFLKSWGDHKALLVVYNEKKLHMHLINMTTCSNRTEHIVDNVTSFQVYVTSDNEFDVFWTSNSELNGYILRNTYKLNGEKTEKANFTRQPEVGLLYDSWKVLLLGPTTSYQWEKRTNGQEVILKIQNQEKTDLWLGSDKHDRFVTSNSNGELGVCELDDKAEIECRTFDQAAKTKNRTLKYNDLLRGHKPEGAKMYSLKNEKFVILFVDRVEDAPEKIRSFTSIVVHPDGHYDHPVEIELEDFSCLTRIDPVNKNYLPPRVNVLDHDDQFCFQFMCSDYQQEEKPTLRYRLKCLKKNLVDVSLMARKSGVSAGSSASIFLVSSIALFINRFFN